MRFDFELHPVSVIVAMTLSAAASSCPAAPEKFLAIKPGASVNDFALQCQHPHLKSEPDSRFAACISYIVAVSEQAAVVKPTIACRRSISEKSFPGGIMEMLFYLATRPDSAGMPLSEAAREAVLIAHKPCA